MDANIRNDLKQAVCRISRASERGTMESERRIRCDIIPGLKRTNMSLPTELGLKGTYDYKDAAPTALPEGLGGCEPLQLCQMSMTSNDSRQTLRKLHLALAGGLGV